MIGSRIRAVQPEGKAFRNLKVSLRSLLLAVAAATLTAGSAPADTKVIRFDIAEDFTRYVPDEAPVFEDGLPAYGNDFVSQGYIYPAGTLNGGNGVFDNGEPEFPDLVIGEWTVRGVFVGDGAKTVTGPIVATTQLYDLGNGNTLVSEGLELVDIGIPIARAITGAPGDSRTRAAKPYRIRSDLT